MKKTFTLLLLSTMCMHLLKAQTYTLAWNSSFSSAWTAGATSRTANNIGGSSVNATVAVTCPEANGLTAFGGFTSPQISSGGSPFTTQLGSNVANLAVGMDLTSKSDYVDITITFSGYSVSHVAFNIADIDKVSATGTTYYDEVLITGTNSGTAVTNPTLTKVNTSSNFFTISGNLASCNTTSGMGGNTASSTADQDGTVTVDFGATILTQVVIRYRNVSAAAPADPAAQAVGIGNISFQRQSLLPVKLTSFTATALTQGQQLQWQSADELNTKEYVVERSTDGVNFSAINKVPVQNVLTNLKNYSYTDNTINTTVVFYRLRINDNDGNFSYSNILVVKAKSSTADAITIFPNPVINNTANIFIPKQLLNKAVVIRVIGQDGKVILQKEKVTYTNTVNLGLPESFHGVAVVEVQQSSDKNIVYREKVLVK